MASPIVIDVPHRLGRAEARRRMRARVGELPGHIPGGVAEVTSSWLDENRMAIAVAALGQRLSAELEAQETRVRVTLDLPPALAFFAGAIEAAVQRKGAELLLGPDSN